MLQEKSGIASGRKVTVDTCDIDDSAPVLRFHVRNSQLGGVESRAKVQCDDLLVDLIGPLDS